MPELRPPAAKMSRPIQASRPDRPLVQAPLLSASLSSLGLGGQLRLLFQLPAPAISRSRRARPQLLDLVHHRAGARRDQAADDDVLLEADQAVGLAVESPPRSAPAWSPGTRPRR